MVEDVRIAVVWTVVGVIVVIKCVLAAWVVSAEEGGDRGVVVEVGAAVSVGVVITVVDLVGVLVGGEETEEVLGVGILYRGLVFLEEVEAASVVVVEVDKSTLVDDVKVLVVTGVEVVDAGEYSVLEGVAEDVTDGREDTTVVTGWLEVSLGEVTVVVGSASMVVGRASVLVAGEVVLVA